MIAFATPEGIRFTLIERFIDTGFVEPVFVPLIAPKALETKDEKYRIAALKFVNTDSLELAELFSDTPDKKLYAGDLLVTQISEDGSKSFHSVIDRSEIVMTLRMQLFGLLFMASLYTDAKNQSELASDIESILATEIPAIQEYFQSAKKVFDGDSSSQDLIIHALKNVAAGDSLKTLLALLSPPDGTSNSSDDILKLYAKVERKNFTPEDIENISKLFEEYKQLRKRQQQLIWHGRRKLLSD